VALAIAIATHPFTALATGTLPLTSCRAMPEASTAPSAGHVPALGAPAAPTRQESLEREASPAATPAPAQSTTPARIYRGLATYYSNRLAGRRTASGEVYDPRALTAAHRDLTFGTVVRVVRVDGGRAVTVRINDRGPFGDEERIIDVSYHAAKELDMLRAGVVPVTVEVLKQGR
jgi:rare lipoprotein A